MMDLSPYIARGFPGDIDRIIATVGVAGIDLQQVQSAVRLCDQTEPILYGPDFSPQRISYRGGRPILECIASHFTGNEADRISAAMAWTRDHIAHPHFAGPTPPDRALTEEQLITSARGYCNEQCRVFIALCEVMQIPARLCFLWHANGKIGHTATEVFLDGRWTFCDVTYQVRVQLPDQSFAEARQLRGTHRNLAHELYRTPLNRWFRLSPSPGTPDAAEIAGWKGRGEGSSATLPSIDSQRGGDLFASIAICNYLIDGVVAIQEVH